VAGAGSGKTSLLVERLMYQLMTADAEPGAFAAMTFTEEAAAEMRERLQGGLAELASSNLGFRGRDDREAARLFSRLSAMEWSPAQIAEIAGGLLDRFEASSICTIHSFCSALLRRHPLEARVAADFRVDEGLEYERFLEMRWEEILSVASGSDSTGAELERALEWMELRDLRILFEDLARSDAPLKEWASGVEPDLGSPLELVSRLEGAPARLRALAEATASRGKYTKFGVACRAAADRAEFLERHSAESLRSAFPQPLEAVKPSERLGADDAHWAARTLKQLNDAWQVDHGAIRAALEWLVPRVLAAREDFRAAGWLTFDDLLLAARDLLRDHLPVRRVEGSRLRTLYVDEFQDTDPIQYEIVFFLAERPDAAARDAWDARLQEGKLFIVGDPKQSIYRFRSADIAAYSRAVEKIHNEGGWTASLTVSFRSPAEILEPVDRAFHDWLPPRDDAERAAHAAPEYVKIAPHRLSPDARFGGAPRVEIWTVDGEGADERRENEAAWIAERIVDHIKKGGLRPRDHAVLLRAFSNVAIYARALQKRNIPFLLDGGKTFYQRVEISDALAWLRAAAEPGDEVAHLAALRSIAGAVPDAELAAFARAGGAFRFVAPVDGAAFPGVARVFGMLRELRNAILTMPAGDALAELMDVTCLADLHAGGYDGAQRVANLEKFVHLAADLARDGRLSIDDVARELSLRFERGHAESERSLSEPGVDAVSILTIHRSKGLEFPVVFCADLAAEENTRDRGTRLRYHSRDHKLEVILRDSKRKTASAVTYRDEAEAHARAESRRLFYVASTRAMERLVWIAGEPRSEARAPWRERLREAFSYLPELPDGALLGGGSVVHRRTPRLGDEALAPPVARDAVGPALRFLQFKERLAGASVPLDSPTDARSRDAQDEELFRPSSLSPGERVARATGRAVHALMEKADFRSPLTIASHAEIAAAAAAAAREEGCDASNVTDQALEIMKGFEEGALRRRLQIVEIVARELPLMAREECARAGYADLVFVEDGELVVADWKTDRLPLDGDANREALFSAAQRHRSQILWYARALARASGRPVRAELFFPRTSQSVVIDTIQTADGQP
jgi:ATP-dependent helicase/nuclease subunit A